MLWLILAIAIIAIFIAFAKKNKNHPGRIEYPYLAARLLFSEAERSFLGILDQAVGSEYRVFGKVRVADIARVKTGLSVSARQGALNRIAFKHFDFIICRTTDLAILCAVELNDKSHSTQHAKMRDQFLKNVCSAISLPLLQIPAKHSYSTSEIRNQFLAAIGYSAVDEPRLIS